MLELYENCQEVLLLVCQVHENHRTREKQRLTNTYTYVINILLCDRKLTCTKKEIAMKQNYLAMGFKQLVIHMQNLTYRGNH